MTTLEERLHAYTAELEGSGDSPHRNADRGPRPARIALLTAAAVLLVVGLVAVAGRGSESHGSGAPGDFSFHDGRVSLHATDFWIDVNGTRFTPLGNDVQVHSDPGWSGYTTLELSWTQHDVEMRTFFYFTADGTNWWADEIRTYDGQPGEAAEWITFTGQFFLSPLATPFTGSFERIREDGDVTTHLHLDGLVIDVEPSMVPRPAPGGVPPTPQTKDVTVEASTATG